MVGMEEAAMEESPGETGAHGGWIMDLLPEEINIPETTNVRPFSTSAEETESEIDDIRKLMESIESEGQLQPGRVMLRDGAENGEPKYDLIMGRRRLRAITMHNLAADEPLRFKAVVIDPEKAQKQYRQALHENIQRKNLSPMDFAHVVRNLREKMKAKNAAGTAKVAEFMGVSPATVTQHEKLLGLSDELQRAIHGGTISREAAFVLSDVPEEQRQEVLDKAIIAQRDELATQGDAEAEAAIAGKPSKRKGKKSGAAGKGGVKAKHVRRAAEAVTGKPSAGGKSKKDIVEWFEDCMGPAYGHPNGAVHTFCRNFILWAKGDLSDWTLTKHFDAMVEHAPKGKAEKQRQS